MSVTHKNSQRHTYSQDGILPLPLHNQSLLHISGCGGSLKTGDRSNSFSYSSRIHRLFSLGARTPARGATTAIPRTSDIVPRFGGGRAILHISGSRVSLKTGDRSNSFSCALRIYQSFSFGAGTPARGATTAIPRTSDIVCVLTCLPARGGRFQY